MKVECSGCGIHLREVPSEAFSEDTVSHGLCDTCFNHFMAQVGMPLPEYLKQIPLPVVTVTSEGNVSSANSKALGLLGKSQVDIQGLPGGNVFECEYAMLPEGCGKTVHCSACTIRNTVMDTMATGKPNRRVTASLQQAGEDTSTRLELLISTERKGGVVFLQIDDVSPCDPQGPAAAKQEACKSALAATP